MARIRLTERETRPNRLPMVCVVCGEPAEFAPHRKFSWAPPWVHILILAGLLPYVIVVAILTKRKSTDMPVCRCHRHNNAYRLLLVLGSFFVMTGLAVGIGFLIDSFQKRDELGGLICLSIGLIILAWFLLIVIVQLMSIRPTEITDSSITLTNVNIAFVDAVREQRDQRRVDIDDDEDDEYDDRRRRRRYDDDDDEYDDDDRPRRRRPRYEDEDDHDDRRRS